MTVISRYCNELTTAHIDRSSVVDNLSTCMSFHKRENTNRKFNICLKKPQTPPTLNDQIKCHMCDLGLIAVKSLKCRNSTSSACVPSAFEFYHSTPKELLVTISINWVIIEWPSWTILLTIYPKKLLHMQMKYWLISTQADWVTYTCASKLVQRCFR